MSSEIRKRPAAEDDLVRQGRYYLEHAGPDVAERFLDAAEKTFTLLASMPEMGRQSSHPSPTLRGVRVFRLSGFEKHLVYYLPLPGNGGIEILHVLHTARDIPARGHRLVEACATLRQADGQQERAEGRQARYGRTHQRVRPPRDRDPFASVRLHDQLRVQSDRAERRRYHPSSSARVVS